MSAGPRYRLAVVNSHPIQYFVPLYRRLDDEPMIDLTAYFCSRAGVESYRDKGFDEEIRWDVPLLDGYEARFLANLGGERRRRGLWGQINPGIFRALREGNYDAIWLHGHNSATNLMAVAAAKATGTALFMRCETHLGLDRPAWKRVLRGPVMTAFYRLFDACLTIGARNAEFYRAHGVPDDEIFLVPYAVDNKRFGVGAEMTVEQRRKVRKELGLPPVETPVVLYLSKLSPRKRPYDLLEAYRRAGRRLGRDAALAFVGTGKERAQLRAEARSMTDVLFLGFRNQSKLPQIYGACDVFVLPSENEPWGLVVNEAMAAGLPVVVSDEVGAAADLVRDGENGFVYPCKDGDALADRLSALLADTDKRKRMGRRSQEIIADWNYERCVDGIRRALFSVCGEQS